MSTTTTTTIGLALIGLTLALPVVTWLKLRAARRSAPPGGAQETPRVGSAAGLVDEALAAQGAHEDLHPVKYTTHQRRIAVHRRAQELALLRGMRVPDDLVDHVRRRVPLK